ncbi:hypothetical protein BGX34_010792 [Mortierella sp. NVP85]|nr:hypothetical protein BGX34_010792 [Mortierella sp. NVP85]
MASSASSSQGRGFGSIGHLPEKAFESICSYLSPSTLAACARVSKLWSCLFTAVLWRELHVTDRRPEPDYKSRRFKQALAKHGHHIQTLKMDYYGPLESFFVDYRAETCHRTRSKGVICNQLGHLELLDIPEFDVLFHNLDLFQFPWHNLDEGLLVRFLQQTSSTLHTLLFNPFPGNRFSFLRVISECMSGLESLSLISTESLIEAEVKPNELQRFLERLPATLEDLTLRVSLYDDEALRRPLNMMRFYPLRTELFIAGDSTPTPGNLAERTLAIKSLVLGGDMSHDTDMVNAFIRRCPHLERLTLQDLCLETFRPLATVLREHCPKLNELSIGAARGPTDDLQLSLLIGASTVGWKRFSLHGVRHPFGPNSATALCKHFKTLEWLVLPKAANLPSRLIRNLLVGGHAPHLKHLDLMHVTPGIFHFYTGLELDANHLVADTSAMTSSPQHVFRASSLRPLPWTCLHLVYLRIKIHNIPRTELLPPMMKRASDMLFGATLEYGAELQRVILSQIGRLVHLEELAFGNTDDQMPECLQYDADGDPIFHESYPQVHSLSLTLEHGLAALASLTKLRVLDVTCMTHRIGNGELSWMKVHWPRLERIDGLLQLVMIPPLKSAVQWLKHNRKGWVPDDEVNAWCRLYEI